MTPILRGMEERGLIRRESLPEDGRASRILLTGEGKAMAAKVQTMTSEASEKLSQNLSSTELAAVLKALRTIACHAEE